MDEGTDQVAERVNDLFRLYRHPSGREYSHREVEVGITERVGTKILDASYLSKVRSGAIKRPSLHAIDALCCFFPVPYSYFFSYATAVRRQPTMDHGSIPDALRAGGIDPDVLRHMLMQLLAKLEK